jgi:hypothetical protein
VRSRLHGIWPRRVEGAGSGLQGAWAGGGGPRAGSGLVGEGRMRGLGCRAPVLVGEGSCRVRAGRPHDGEGRPQFSFSRVEPFDQNRFSKEKHEMESKKSYFL